MKLKGVLLVFMLAAYSAVWALVPPRNPEDTAAYRELLQRMMRSKAARAPQREAGIATPAFFPRVPVIMVNYTDMSYRVSRADVDSMFNGEHFTLYGATGSVRRYFYDQSEGLYNPRFDIYGPVTASRNYAYYGAGNGSSRATELMLEACALMDDSLDFTQYDTDGDGTVDMVYVLYAGPPASDGACTPTSWISNPTSQLIWPHYWTVSDAGMTSKRHVFDNVTVEGYEVSSELDGCASSQTTTVMAGVGLACHEFGHGMGLPDLYSTNGANHKTCGMWDIMDYGCYNNDVRTPPAYSAYERWFMGWKTPRLLAAPETVSLAAINAGGESLLIASSGIHNLNGVTPSPADFYIVENRQKTGWDAYIPGEGMMVTHIRYDAGRWSLNHVNNDVDAMGVDIVEADGLQPTSSQSDLFYGKPGDLYPTGSDSFTECANYAVTNITASAGLVHFNFTCGTATPDAPTLSPYGDDETVYTLTGQPVRLAECPHGIFIVHRNGKTYKIIK